MEQHDWPDGTEASGIVLVGELRVLTIYAIAVNGSDIIVGGSFTSIGGVAITNRARWDGTNWSSIGAGVGGGSVRAIAFFNGYMFVGGTFNRAGTNAVGYIARWMGPTGTHSEVESLLRPLPKTHRP
jgi:hypothetical protein